MLNTNILVLDASYMPVGVVNTKQAMTMLYRNVATVLDKDYNKHSFDTWSKIDLSDSDDYIGLSNNRKLKMPRILVLHKIHGTKYSSRIKTSRHNIFRRDRYTCQYCGTTYGKHRLNIDHVIPRAQGGKTQWDNLTTSCIQCNSLKGPRTPEQAKLKLLSVPKKPNWILPHGVLNNKTIYEEWRPFLQHLNLDLLNVKDE